MKMRKLAGMLVAAALVVPAGSAQADVATTGKVTGAGTVTDLSNPFAPVRIGVNARSVDGVAEGRVIVRNADFSFVGDVQCYVQDGDTVQLAGQVVASKDLSGGWYALSIEDNGGGDQVALNASGDVPLECGQAGAPIYELEDGNVTVHDAE